jgi:chromosomal replication initiation ATPase DnaA
LAKRIVEGGKIRESDLRSGGRGRRIAESRRLFCQLAVKKMGYAGAEVGRFLGVTTSAVNKVASSAEVSEIGNYL